MGWLNSGCVSSGCLNPGWISSGWIASGWFGCIRVASAQVVYIGIASGGAEYFGPSVKQLFGGHPLLGGAEGVCETNIDQNKVIG